MAEYFNSKLGNLIDRLKNYKAVLRKNLYSIIMDHEYDITLMVTDDQLYKRGINGDGVEIFSYQPYTVNTQFIKAMYNQPADRVTLRSTGEFHSTFFIQILDNGFLINAADSKTNKLIEKYGEEIFKLTDENLARLIDDILRPELIIRMNKYLLDGE